MQMHTDYCTAYLVKHERISTLMELSNCYLGTQFDLSWTHEIRRCGTNLNYQKIPCISLLKNCLAFIKVLRFFFCLFCSPFYRLILKKVWNKLHRFPWIKMQQVWMISTSEIAVHILNFAWPCTRKCTWAQKKAHNLTNPWPKHQKFQVTFVH